jgi:hypothetical protein
MLWGFALGLIAIRWRGLEALDALGLVSFFRPGGKGSAFWFSLFYVCSITAFLSRLLAYPRRIIAPLRNVPLFDFLLVTIPLATGGMVSLIRVFATDEGADALAKLEPLLATLGIPLLLTSAGAIFLSPIRNAWPAIKSSRSPFLLLIVVTNLLGAVCVATFLYLLALTGQFHPSRLWFLSALVMALGFPLFIRQISRLENPERLQSAWDWKAILLAGALLSVLVGSCFLSFLPPDDSDELRYHLSIPKRYLEHHSWVDIEGQLFSHFPLGMEMLFAIPLSLDWLRPERFGLVTGVKFVHTWFFALSLMLLVVWTREGRREEEEGSANAWLHAELLAAWVYVSIPFAPVLASWAFVDFGSAFGWLVSAYLVWRWVLLPPAHLPPFSLWEKGAGGMRFEPLRDNFSKRGLLPLAGIAVGWSLMVKYPSLAWWVLLTATAFLFRARQPKRWFSLWPLLIIPPLLAAPWLIHNGGTTGNPFSPLLSSWFGGGFDPLQQAFYDWHAGMKGGLNEFRQMSEGTKLLDLIALPFRAAIFPERFEGNPIGGLILFLIPLSLLGFLRSNGHRALTFIPMLCAGVFILWGLTYRDPRFAIPLWGFLALGAGWGFGWIARTGEDRLLAGLTLAIVIWGFSQCDEVFLRLHRFRDAIFLSQPLDEYLNRPDRLTVVATIREVEAMRKEAGGADGKPPLLLLGQEQSYYFDSPVRGNDYFDGPELAPLARQSSSAEEISGRIKSMGYKWVWVNRGTLEGNLFNLVRGDIFSASPTAGLTNLTKIATEYPGGLHRADHWLNETGKNNAAFRRMHAWLVKHPGFREVPLNTAPEEERPICPLYGAWLTWPEMAGTSAMDLPRRNISLLVAD